MLRAVLVLALVAYSTAAAQKPFLESTNDELVRAVPELAGAQFDSNQDRLSGLLRATGENLESMFAKLVEVSAAEDVHEMRFEDSMSGDDRHEAFRYVVKALPSGGQEQFDEFRVDAKTGSPVQPPTHIDFLVLTHFVRLLNFLLPQYQEGSPFRYIGRSHIDGQDCFVVAFGQGTKSQGILWIDAAAKRIVRFRLNWQGPLSGIPLETVTTDIALVPVTFSASVLWLPSRVTVQARYAGGDLHSVHRYSDYQSEKDAGVPAVAAANEEDAYELLARAMTLGNGGKFGEAAEALREAVRLNPELPAARFYLGNALRNTGDLTGAETELREAAKLLPDSGAVDNLLGIVLSKRGDLPGSVAAFRKSAAVQPKEPIPHFNLAQALEKSGDRAGALAEYRTASELAPDNAAIKTRYEQLEHAANTSPAPEATIKVDVRQVLVPVVVTDKEGHHITGLTQADFHVFEDGVEQKISAFTVEDSAVTAAPAVTAASVPAPEPGSGQATAVPPVATKPAPARRTYVICIDSLHTAFGNLVYVRKALQKLFQSEPPGGSNYAVLAIGTSTQVLQNTTSDPQKVLDAIGSKDFQKLYLASQKISVQSDLVAYRRYLDEVRAACDAGKPECPSGKASLPGRANQIASEERIYTVSFLSQFRTLVQTLSQASGRRTMLFVSDGFQLVPGKEAFDLLEAYFPDLRSVSLRSVDRMTELDPILRLSANSNVPIYTIDSRGLYTSPFFDASNPGGTPRMMPAVMSIMDSNASADGSTLSEIAAATGGTAFRNNNNILAGFERAFADGHQYYMLAYVPENANPDGKFRAIIVRLRDKKMVVNAKRGYWASTN